MKDGPFKRAYLQIDGATGWAPFEKVWELSKHTLYLKHGGREPVTSKKRTLRQVVPNFTGQVVSSKILRIFR